MQRKSVGIAQLQLSLVEITWASLCFLYTEHSFMRTSLVAESQTLFSTVRLVCLHGWTNVLFESYCQVLCKDILNSLTSPSWISVFQFSCQLFSSVNSQETKTIFLIYRLQDKWADANQVFHYVDPVLLPCNILYCDIFD